MTRVAVLALAAACGTHAPPVELPAPRPVTRAPDAAVSAQVLPAAPLVRTDGAQGGAEAPSAGAITAIAMTPDGSAAVTADEVGGVRLWPALDGSREPRVIMVPEPHALAVGARGDGFTIAVLDASGGLYLANVDRDGRSRSHVTLPGEPAYLGIAMTPGGLVAWRADETVTLLDGDGATLGQLATKPGERLVTVAVAGGHAAALVERGGKRGVRGIVMTGGLAWNDWIDLGDEIGGTLAVSPSGKLLAVREKDQVAVLDASGKLVETASSFATDVLAFVDDDTLAFATRSGLAWHGIGKNQSFGPRDATAQLLAVGGGRAVSSVGGELVLATQKQTQYLGYGVVSPTVAQPAIDGQLVIGLGDSFLTLDRALHVAGEPTFPVPSGTQVADLRWLGGDAWAVEASAIDEGTTSLVLVGGGKSKVVRGGLTVSHVLMYEPSTQLLTLSLGNAPSVYRFDPKTLELVKVATLGADSYTQTELVPLAPARAGGSKLLHVSLRDVTTVDWLRDPGKLAAATSSVRFPGAIAAADAAGHVFGWQSTASGVVELAVFAAGKRIGTLPTDGPVSLWPEPTGEHIVELGMHDVSLVALDGTRRWVQQIEGASQALWLADGGLAIVTAAGVARLDGKTGAITAARCGWQFGLSAKPHPPAPRVEPVCVALEPGH